MRRRAAEVDGLLPRYRAVISGFTERTSLQDSSIIMDGPGIGCTSHGLVLAILGRRRLSKLRAVHFFSSSGYGAFFYDARERDELNIDGEDVSGWNRRNQRRHHVRPVVTALGFLTTRLCGKRWYFRNHLLADALRSTVTEAYANIPLRSLPQNFHFWTCDTTAAQFCDINAVSPYSHRTPAEIVTSLAAVPGIYEPFEKEGHVYIDAMRGPGVRGVLLDLRKQSENVLFWHMNREGRQGRTTFLKGHNSSTALARVSGDFMRFLLGIDNAEVDRAMS